MNRQGIVYLVGAGPGDPELLTIKARRLLNEADAIFYDRLVSQEILRLIPKGVTCIAVGKSKGNHCMPQREINNLLVTTARRGRRVVRLKGGDPYMFGRGGEEAQTLKQHKIAFEVVPGITAAAGCSAYAGIPLTHRGLSHGVRFLTGHFRNDEELDIDWNKLADPDCTLVIYMGLASLQRISAELINAGLRGSTPAAAINRGTTTDQVKVISTLSDLPEMVMNAGLQAPVMIIIGEVVSLNTELDWFQDSVAGEVVDDETFNEDTRDLVHA
jgi:uroporphyrin-III C-methyltransferase/precorrin-2 dehydrogenase/sirohydrochlorin ferrochelatase/uroporphyrin-III C-methyltransferase